MAAFEYANTPWLATFTSLGVNANGVEDAYTTCDRDAAMTRDSDYDILRYRTEEEAKKVYGSAWWPRVSNTEMNERRRRGITSQKYGVDNRNGKEVEGREILKESNTESKRSKLGMFLGRR
jgi:hypothetical protein